MNRKAFKNVALVLMIVVASLLVVGSVSAAGPDGMGPNTGWAPSGKSHTIGVGQTQWFSFQYGGGGSQIMIQLWGSGAEFSVYTPDEGAAWMQGSNPSAIGVGSANSKISADRSWSGNFKMAGTYYVKVTQSGSSEATYSLLASGDSVWFTQGAAASTTTTTTTTTTSQPAAMPVAKTAAGGTGTADALTTIDGKWRMLGAGQSVWYAFQYAGDKSQLRIDLNLPIGDVATAFSVITPAEATAFASGAALTPIGRGSPDKFDGSGLFWSGNFDTAGTYYVKIDAGANAASYYSLTITP